MVKIDWNSELYDQKHAFVFEYGKSLVSILDPQPHEIILDLGCGTGPLTHDIAQAGVQVIGIDRSPDMIEKARAMYPDLKFQVADARTFTFPYQFDAIFSNATLHWIKEAEAVIEHIAAALKPGGRLVAEFGGRGNVNSILTSTQQTIREMLHIESDSGWYFPSIGEYTPLLEKHGLQVQSAILFDRPTKLAGAEGLRNWISMFGAHMLRDVPETMKADVINSVENKLRGQFFQGDHWIADYKRLRLVAYKGSQAGIK
jgi:trans-aconitate methyltransferase